MPQYAIVGFGNAGYHAARAIRTQDRQSPIHVYSDTALPPSNPMLTTYYVKGALSYENLFPHGNLAQITRELNLTFHAEAQVVKVCPQSKTLTLSDGAVATYDKLLIATGASAFVPGAEGMKLPGVCAVRTPEDALRLKEAIDQPGVRSVLVVGASMVGIKVVELAKLRGLRCTLIDGAPYMFPLAAMPDVAQRIQDYLTAQDVSLAFSAFLSKIVTAPQGHPDGRLTAVMQDGATYSADLIAVCIGTRANTSLVQDTSIAVGRGIQVDRHMETSVPGVYAAGDCCEGYELQSGERRIIGLWANAGYQGRAAGENMAGGEKSFDYTILHNISHFMGIDFLGMGDITRPLPTDRFHTWERGDLFIKVAQSEDGTLKGLNMLGGAAVSGIIKNHFMKGLAGGAPVLDVESRCKLMGAGFPQDFIDFIGGGTHVD